MIMAILIHFLYLIKGGIGISFVDTLKETQQNNKKSHSINFKKISSDPQILKHRSETPKLGQSLDGQKKVLPSQHSLIKNVSTFQKPKLNKNLHKNVENLLNIKMNEGIILSKARIKQTAPIEITCKYCDEKLAFHLMNEHCKLCEKLADFIHLSSFNTEDPLPLQSLSTHLHTLKSYILSFLQETFLQNASRPNSSSSLPSSNHSPTSSSPNTSTTASPSTSTPTSPSTSSIFTSDTQATKVGVSGLETVWQSAPSLTSPSQESMTAEADKGKIISEDDKNKNNLIQLFGMLDRILNNLQDQNQVEKFMSQLSNLKNAFKENHENPPYLFIFSNYIFKLILASFRNIKIGDSQSISSIPSAPVHKNSINDFKVIKPISRGAFGRVDIVQHKLTSQIYAMKTLKKRDMVAKNLVSQGFSFFPQTNLVQN